MSQSPLQSLVEVVTNTSIGVVGSWLIAYSVMSSTPDAATASTITVAGCTVWSVLRSWVVRRVFNRWETAPAQSH